MSIVTTADVRSELEQAESDFERRQGWLDDISQNDSSLINTTDTLHRTARRAGTFAAFLDEREEAKMWFSKAAEYAERSAIAVSDQWDDLDVNRRDRLPRILFDGIVCAIIAQDEELIEQIAWTALDLDDRYLKDPKLGLVRVYYTSKALAALVLDDDRVDTYIETIHDVETTGEISPVTRLLFRRISAIDALHAHDADAVEHAIEGLLNQHEKESSDNLTDSTVVMNRDATAFVILARQRGLDVQVQSPYIPSALVDYDSGPDSIPTE